MRIFSTILTTLALISLASVAYSRDPIGETAPYLLDKNPSRTTSMIQSGSALATVTQFLPDHANGPSYDVSLDYDFNIQFYGRQKGTTKWAFPQEFFEPRFMERLRQTGSYETPDYKIRHEGFADARNPDGGVYPRCDKILIYDVRIPELFAPFLYAAAGFGPGEVDNPQLEDLKIRGHMFSTVPVLGAAKLDLSAKVQGMNVKAGFDYRRP
jgi:hypothetical protein